MDSMRSRSILKTPSSPTPAAGRFALPRRRKETDMFRALYWKELRASWPFAVVALLAQGILCAICLEEAPINPISVFEEQEILHLLEILSVGFGFFLGLWQTLPESAMGTTEFLVQT